MTNGLNTTRLSQARRLWVHDEVPRHIARHNMRKWVKSVRRLGRDWKALPTVSRLKEQMQ